MKLAPPLRHEHRRGELRRGSTTPKQTLAIDSRTLGEREEKTHRSLLLQLAPPLQTRLQIPQCQVRDGDLPKADVMQIAVLRL